MIDPSNASTLSEPTDLLAMDQGRWRREPLIVEALPLEAYPIYAGWYAEIADTADLIGNTGEAEYARQMVAKFGGTAR